MECETPFFNASDFCTTAIDNFEMDINYENIKQEMECILDDDEDDDDDGFVPPPEPEVSLLEGEAPPDTRGEHYEVYEIYEFANEDHYRQFKKSMPKSRTFSDYGTEHCNYGGRYNYPTMYSDHDDRNNVNYSPQAKRKCISTPSQKSKYSNNTSIRNNSLTQMQTQLSPKDSQYEKHFVRLCPFCGIEFSADLQWRKHLNGMHHFGKRANIDMDFINADQAKCRQCDLILNANNFAKLQQHNITHLPYGNFLKCKICQKQTSTVSNIVVHLKVKHGSFLKRNQWEEKHSKAKSDDDDDNDNEDEDEQFDSFYNNSSGRFEGDISELTAGTVVKSRRVSNAEKLMRFVCPACPDWQINTLADLNAHIRTVHQYFAEFFVVNADGTMLCTQCNKTFMNSKSRSMMKHQFSHLSIRPYGCQQCSFVAKDITKVKRHIMKAHMHMLDEIDAEDNNSTEAEVNTSTLIVTPKKSTIAVDPKPTEANVSKARMAYCSEKTTALNQFHEHISYACPECNETLPTQQQWHQHINNDHDFFEEGNMQIETGEDGLKRCKECGLKMNGGTLHMQRHRLTHMPYKSFICSLCNHRSNTQNVLIDHIRRRHFAQGEYKCVMCPLVLPTSYEQGLHMKAHKTADWPATVCRICFRNFSKVSALRVHMETHDTERKKYPCDYCERYYLSACEVRRHQIRAHPETIKGTAADDSSNRNGKVETRIKLTSKLQCIVCLLNFLTQEALQVHLQAHDPEDIPPKTVCPICWNCFDTTTGYHNHMRTHNREEQANKLYAARKIVAEEGEEEEEDAEEDEESYVDDDELILPDIS